MSYPQNAQRAEYADHIEKQKSSGISIKKYCESNNLSESKFSYYRTYKLQSQKPKSFSEIKIKPAIKQKSEPLIGGLSQVDPVWLAKFIHNLVKLK